MNIRFLMLTSVPSLALAADYVPEIINSPAASRCEDKFPRCKNSLGSCKMPEYREMCCLACRNASPILVAPEIERVIEPTEVNTVTVETVGTNLTKSEEEVLEGTGRCEDASWCIDQELTEKDCMDPYYSIKACCLSCSRISVPSRVVEPIISSQRPKTPSVKIQTSYKWRNGKLLQAEDLKHGF